MCMIWLRICAWGFTFGGILVAATALPRPQPSVPVRFTPPRSLISRSQMIGVEVYFSRFTSQQMSCWALNWVPRTCMHVWASCLGGWQSPLRPSVSEDMHILEITNSFILPSPEPPWRWQASQHTFTEPSTGVAGLTLTVWVSHPSSQPPRPKLLWWGYGWLFMWWDVSCCVSC